MSFLFCQANELDLTILHSTCCYLWGEVIEFLERKSYYNCILEKKKQTPQNIYFYQHLKKKQIQLYGLYQWVKNITLFPTV